MKKKVHNYLYTWLSRDLVSWPETLFELESIYTAKLSSAIFLFCFLRLASRAAYAFICSSLVGAKKITPARKQRAIMRKNRGRVRRNALFSEFLFISPLECCPCTRAWVDYVSYVRRACVSSAELWSASTGLIEHSSWHCVLMHSRSSLQPIWQSDWQFSLYSSCISVGCLSISCLSCRRMAMISLSDRLCLSIWLCRSQWLSW